MELRHLRSFVAVADELHFTRAAERLQIAQSPLSQHIQRLERELGCALFERNRRKVALTDAGREMLDHARIAIDQADRAAAAARAVAAGHQGHLGIGLLASAALELLPRIIPPFAAAAPDAQLSFVEGNSREHLDALRARRIDVAFIRPPADAPDLHVERIWTEPIIAALPATHPLAGTPRLRLADLRADNLITFPPDSAPDFHQALMDACRKAGFEPRIRQQALAMPMLVALVSAGLGVALLPRSMRQLTLAGVAYHDLTDVAARAEIALVHRAGDQRPLLARFTTTVRHILTADDQGPNNASDRTTARQSSNTTRRS